MTSRQFNLRSRERRNGVFLSALAVWSVCAAAGAWTLAADSKTVVEPSSGAQIAFTQPTASQLPALDAKRLFALGMIETGNNDGEVGAAGEVSRYQIHPLVWKVYSQRPDYRNTAAAIQVARQHWAWLAEYFLQKAGRKPTDFDMYVMWNTRFGYYAKKGFSSARLAATVKDRAERFVNLVNRKG